MSRYILQKAFDPKKSALYESLFMVGNGHIGLRGAEEEPCHTGFRGSFINGFFEKKPIKYGEWAYGYAKDHETILNIADVASIKLHVDGFPLDFSTGLPERYLRRLDLEAGRLERELVWASPSGARVMVSSSRLASFARPDVVAMRYEVRALAACRIEVVSFLDASVRNRASAEGDPRVGSHLDPDPIAWAGIAVEGASLRLRGTTRRSGLGIALACAHARSVTGGEDRVPAVSGAMDGETLSARFETAMEAGESFRLDKFVALCDGTVGMGADGGSSAMAALEDRAASALRAAALAGYEAIEKEQEASLARFWTGARIELDGDPDVEEGLRFNAFHLFQSAGRDGRTNLAAKGLSGEGYEGHYFWDTEIYAMPFFTYAAPDIARALVTYRIGTLDKARARARELSLPGALFPWRTIDGEETSAYYPAGTAQFHIDADIAYALSRYVASSGDDGILGEGGAELLFETARLWMGLGFFNPRKGGKFCIPCVTGPDEYTALVDNNAYTNLMAEFNLRKAAEAAGRFGVPEAEAASWSRAADSMYLPYDPETGIVPQDDQFMDRQAWDLGATRAGDFPLLLHYHPLMLYRKRVLKQPDTVLAIFLRHDRFDPAAAMRNFRFYEPLTTGDSSLSHCIQSVMAAECGLIDKAYGYFETTVRMDLDDVHGNSRDGVHIASMAGSWISAVYGFAGMRENDAGLSFKPSLPSRWSRLAFNVAYRGRRIACEYTRDESRYRLLEGDDVEIGHEGVTLRLARGKVSRVDERPRPATWIFDLDGVIADSAELHFLAWERLAKELGVPFGRKDNEALKGVSRMGSLMLLLGEKAREYDESRLGEFAARKNGYYVELIGRTSPADILPGMEALLEGLKRDGAKIALASASRNAPEVLDRLGIAGLFDAIVDPGSLAVPKPDPEIFLRAAGLCGARIKDCVALEDAQAGIDAIRAAGIFAVGIGSGLSGADIRFDETATVDRVAIEKAFLARR